MRKAGKHEKSIIFWKKKWKIQGQGWDQFVKLGKEN